MQGSPFSGGAAADQGTGLPGRPAASSPAAIKSRPNAVIDEAQSQIIANQAGDGHWLYELEADATIPAENFLLEYFTRLARGDDPRRVVYVNDHWLDVDDAFDLARVGEFL